MNYEKKYKEVQKWITSIYTKLNYIHQIEAEALFPTLRESKGERIRETLIEYIKHWQKGYSKWNSDKDFCKDAIAWLEREKPVTFSFEEGERIRKALLRLVHDTTRDELLDNYEVHKEKALEWLEKQGNSIEEIKGNKGKISTKWSEDERIRKELLSFIQNWKDPENIYGDAKSRPMFTKNENQCDKYIAWLESLKERLKNNKI